MAGVAAMLISMAPTRGGEAEPLIVLPMVFGSSQSF
jgi:hypothetical protein